MDAQTRNVLRVASGNVLEMYDFLVYAFYAPYIAKAYFPADSEVASLLAAFVVFGVGFLMRPLGAIVLGAYIDHHGRRKGLLVTLSLMALGTLIIAATPSFALIGIGAPVLVVVGRLLQGFSAGAEPGGVLVYLAEIAPAGKMGLYTAWQPASQQVAVLMAAVLGAVLVKALPDAAMEDYGWRIPFAVGCIMIPFVFTMRRSLTETDDFAKRSAPPSMGRIIASIMADGRVVLAGTCIIVMATVTFYLVKIYTPSFGRTVLKHEPTQTFIATCCVAIASFIITPIMAALSDHFGRRPLMIGVAALTLITVWPAMAWLVAEPSFGRLVAVQLWLAFLYSAYVGPVTVAIAEVMSIETRTIGFALTYSLAVSTGGFAPAVATYLVERFHSQAAPAAYAMAAAAIGIIGVVALPRKRTAGGHPA